MSNFSLSPNMSLLIPTPGVEPGPQYATDLNSSLTIVDGHNHTPGSGVLITPQALNVNSDLTFQNNFATNIAGLQLSAPSSYSTTATLYTNTQSGGGIVDLFYNDGAGNIIPITKAGAINATAANIPGESYSGGTFTWVQGATSTTPANFDIGQITIRPNIAATTNGITLQCPTGIASAYPLVLPALPGVKSIMALDTAGNITAPYTVDNSTIVIASNVIKVPAQGITTTQIANNTIVDGNMASKTLTNASIANQTITQGLLAPRPSNNPAAAGEIAYSSPFSFSTSSTSGVFVTGASVTLTTTGRPVVVFLQTTYNLAGATTGQIEIINASNSNLGANIYVINGGIGVQQMNIGGVIPAASTDTLLYPPSVVYALDTGVSGTPGTYTYTIETNVASSSATILFTNCVLVAYEL